MTMSVRHPQAELEMAAKAMQEGQLEHAQSMYRKIRAVQTASKWQVRQPIYNSSVRRWKNYECHLQPMFEALRERGIHCGEQ